MQDFSSVPRKRVRQILPQLHLGLFPTGEHNSITDVPGVLVHLQSVHRAPIETFHAINTGVTTILPRREIWDSGCYAGLFRFNVAGELTGSHQIEETGLLTSPIILTNTFAVGAAHQGAVEHYISSHRDSSGLVEDFVLPVVAETWDGHLNDVGALAIIPDHVVQGIKNAHRGPVMEGCTGGGTGMTCHGFKAGTGTASRKVLQPAGFSGCSNEERYFVLGALVQANYGVMELLRVGGRPVGMQPAKEHDQRFETTTQDKVKDGSTIVVLATTAPLLPHQLQRLTKRATIGLGRVGGAGANSSEGPFIAFSTAAHISPRDRGEWAEGANLNRIPQMLLDSDLDTLLEAAADVVEESITTPCAWPSQ